MNNIVTLEDLFHNRVFWIPDYQRGYSWEQRHVQEFLEDLELLAPRSYHYTGTVVLQEPPPSSNRFEDEDGNTYSHTQIVDGQQRLTTIVLLLDGIRRSLSGISDKAEKLSHGIKKKFIAAQEINGQPLFKLSLNEDTDHFFRSSILADKPSVEGPQITSARRLEAAKKQIAVYLKANTETERDAAEGWLQTLYRKVATQLRFTLYQVEDEAEVGVIFEVMNDRGKPLTDLEKVKNYLLHASVTLGSHGVSNELAKSVNGAWAEILRRLMAASLVSSADEDRLLRADWLTHHNPQPKLWEGSKSIKGKFDLRQYKDQYETLLNLLSCYTEGLRASCVSFCDAYQPNRPDAFESFKVNTNARLQVIEWSARLVRIGVVVTFLPLLLAVRERWPGEPEVYLEVLKLCEAFAFRVYRLNRRRSNAGQSALFSLGYELATTEYTFDNMIRAIKSQLAYYCGDADFQKLTSADEPDQWYGRTGLRYFLYEYEIALASQQGASPFVTWDELRSRDLQDTIEHILPQSIQGQGYWCKKFRGKKHQQYVHDLGNLTLTKHNSHYQNNPFPDKKGMVGDAGHCYANSPLYIERELTHWEHWDASEINERRAKLFKWARGRWAVDLSCLEDEKHEPELIEEEADEDIEVFEEAGDGGV